VNRRRRAGDDAGTMLVELLVGMILMSIIGVIVLDGILGGFKAQRVMDSRSAELASLRTAVQRVTREIREANPVRYATATTLTIYHETDTGSVTKTWQLDTTDKALKVSGFVVTNGVTTTLPTTTVVSGLDVTKLPFSYAPVPLWVAPAGSTVDASTCAISGTSPVEYEGKYCIGSVTLRLALTTTANPVSVTATVDVRNQQ
jgi:type II secretory pathway pseudopilin PulG